MMWLRSILFVIYLYGMMGLLGTLFLVSLVLPRTVIMAGIRVYARSIRFGMRWICGIETEIRGQEHMPPGASIYAGKHQCMFDIFVPFLVTSDPAIILKRELLFYPFLGWYAIKAHMIPIDRAGTTKTLKKMLSEAKDRAARGRQIVIFPEGTRTEPGAAPAYQPAGISAFNKALDLPIVPVATNAGLCWPAHGLMGRPGRVIYEILPPIPPGLDRKTLMSRLETDLETASNRLLAEGLVAQGRAPDSLASAA